MINLLLPLIGEVIDRVVPDKNGALKAKAAIEKSLVDNANTLNLAQAKINMEEAKHRSIFVAGWRPFLGWVAASGFAWMFVLQPLAQWLLVLQGNPITLPVFQTDILLELTFAMLGLASLRTFEKAKGLSR